MSRRTTIHRGPANHRSMMVMAGVAGAGLLAYLLWPKRALAAGVGGTASGKLTQSSPPAGLNAQAALEIAGSTAPTAQQVVTSQSSFGQLTPVGAITTGFINFPSGSQAAAALFDTRMDMVGNYYVMWAGQLYRVGSQDMDGNWPATLAN